MLERTTIKDARESPRGNAVPCKNPQEAFLEMPPQPASRAKSPFPAAAVAPAAAGSGSMTADAARRCQFQVLSSAKSREESDKTINDDERMRKAHGRNEQPQT